MPEAPARSRPIEIGVEMMAPFAGSTWASSARELEARGFATLFVPDHLDEGLGPIVAMATAAEATTSLRVASAVFGIDFRHPAVISRELASIDVLSRGRLEVGLGAGYQVDDYRRSGLTMDPPGQRVDRLMEHVEILRGLFSSKPFSFTGEHYSIRELTGTPKPHTDGGPPILIAGGGRRMLTFAGQQADIVGVNIRLPSSDLPGAAHTDLLPDAIDRKLAWVMDGAGARFEELVIHGWLRYAVVTNRARKVAEQLAARYGVDVSDILSSPLLLVGSVDAIVEKLVERRERWGFSYYTITQQHASDFDEVLRKLRDV